jgi:hypothetical protein
LIPGLSKVICKFKRPELLRSPQIPAPMSGVNPRSIMGQAWWDKKRRAAYRKNNYHCWGCGVPAKSAQWRRYLEAHERYNIDYMRGTMRLVEVVALCHSCHNFIHMGRLSGRLERGEIGIEYAQGIVNHGYAVLRAAGLEPWWSTRLIVEGIHPTSLEPGVLVGAPWEKWRLLLGGRRYGPKFKDEEEMNAYYEGRS